MSGKRRKTQQLYLAFSSESRGEAHHTTHIEGTRLTLEQAMRLLEGNPVPEADPDDVPILMAELVAWLNSPVPTLPGRTTENLRTDQPTFETRSEWGASSPYRARCGLVFCATPTSPIARISRWHKGFCELASSGTAWWYSLAANRNHAISHQKSRFSRTLTSPEWFGFTTLIGEGGRPANRKYRTLSATAQTRRTGARPRQSICCGHSRNAWAKVPRHGTTMPKSAVGRQL